MTAAAASWLDAPLWDATWQRMDRERLDALHLKRIQELIAYAYGTLPFYRNLYDAAGVTPDKITSWQDFYERVPVLDKTDLVSDQEESGAMFGLEATDPGMRAWFHRTSGTTGTPLNEVFTSYDRLMAAYEAWAYGWWDAGLRPGNSMYFAFNFGTFIGFWSALFSAERLGLMIIPGGGLDTRQRIKQIHELRPHAVVGTPTYLLHMGETARQDGQDLGDAGVRVLVTAAEVGPNVPSFRRELRNAWGSPVITDAYGISECIFLACECRAVDAGDANGHHVIERYIHSYAADLDSYQPVAHSDQVGEHIVTTFRLAQPLIKYRTHDLVRHQPRPDHGCGWSFGFVDGGVLGRSDDMIRIKGTNVYTSAVQRMIGSVDDLSPHYELHVDRDAGQDVMSIRVECAQGVPPERYDEVAARLVEELRYNIGVSIAVEVLEPESLPRYELKSKRVFDHRREADA